VLKTAFQHYGGGCKRKDHPFLFLPVLNEKTECILEYLIRTFKLSYFFLEPDDLSLNVSICTFSFFVFLDPLLSPAC